MHESYMVECRDASMLPHFVLSSKRGLHTRTPLARLGSRYIERCGVSCGTPCKYTAAFVFEGRSIHMPTGESFFIAATGTGMPACLPACLPA